MNKKTYVFPWPKETQDFLATYGSAPLRETRRRCRIDVYRELHFDFWSCQVRPATGKSFPLGKLRKLLSIYIEECNSNAPSISSSIICFIRPIPTANTLEKGTKKGKNVPMSILISFTWMFVSFTWMFVSFIWMFVSIRSLLLKRSFREAQSFWHVSIHDFKSPLMTLIVRSVKSNY